MAWFTRRSIVESHAQFEKTRRQSEQHHQDGFRPIVILMPYDGIDPVEDRSFLVGCIQSVAGEDRRICAVQCRLRNVGVGPALNVRLGFRAMGRDGYGISRELTPLCAGEERGGPKDPLYIHFRVTKEFNETDVATAGGMGWEIVLEYEDVFGNSFYTIHRKNPQMPWTECGKGPAPST